MKKLIYFSLFLFLLSCNTKPPLTGENLYQPTKMVDFFDASRDRKIPVALYYKKSLTLTKMPVVIFSHGYGRNKPGSNLTYQYLLANLAQKGYFVASIQHELPTDDLVPSAGKPQVVRRPNWDRGAENILFVLNQLKKGFIKLNYRKVAIAGHSNGGDMSVLFVDQHPDLVWKLITLDQRRYPFPHLSKPKIYSLRSSDQPADEGVLPTLEEQKNLGMTIFKLPNTIHNDMNDGGTVDQKIEILDYFLKFLEEN